MTQGHKKQTTAGPGTGPLTSIRLQKSDFSWFFPLKLVLLLQTSILPWCLTGSLRRFNVIPGPNSLFQGSTWPPSWKTWRLITDLAGAEWSGTRSCRIIGLRQEWLADLLLQWGSKSRCSPSCSCSCRSLTFFGDPSYSPATYSTLKHCHCKSLQLQYSNNMSPDVIPGSTNMLFLS